MRILWLIDLEYDFEMRHGASLRFFSLARELISQGCEVYFATHRKATDDPRRKAGYLEQLRDRRYISGYFETSYAPEASFRRVAQLAVHPSLVNRLLAPYQEPTRKQVEEFIGKHRIDLCICSNRALLFLVPAISRTSLTFIDWIDCMVLFWLREIRLGLSRGRLVHMPYLLRRLVQAYLDESYYGRQCHVNLTVSPADKRCLDGVNRRPRRNKVLLNGVRPHAARSDAAPVKNRLIISGNMSFPPNYEGAIWFIDKVMPLLRARRRGVVLTVAGANPVAALLARRSADVVVTGFVDDLQNEIAQSELCVAPLISGGGFKNKIVEAIAAGRFVVATSRAVEFLDATASSYLPVGDTPEAMAGHILSYLEDPSRYEPALAALRRLVHEEFSWTRRADELLHVARACTGESAPPGRRHARQDKGFNSTRAGRPAPGNARETRWKDRAHRLSPGKKRR